LRLSEQLNSPLSDQNGEQVGTVDDMILDLDKAMVAYVIVNAGEKQVAVPWDQLNISTDKQPGNFMLKADADMLANAPAIDLSTLPAIGESAADWDSDLRSYWKSSNAGGAQPSTGSQNKLRGVMLASQVLATDLSVPSQTTLQANIEDLIVNAQSGKIQFVVIKTNVDNTERWLPVPLALFNWDTASQAFNLDLNADLLQAALPALEAQFPDINVEGWEQQWMTFWQNHGVNMTP
jgi:sporulation protein YlmC with PRC-barrel domain